MTIALWRISGPGICNPRSEAVWGEALGKVDGSVAASVVYGGPFNVFEEDRHAFLSDENRWIEVCISKGVPLLGICQGAQSIARVLGAHVGPKTDGTHEFGYYEIEATPEGLGMFPPKLWLLKPTATNSSCPRVLKTSHSAIFLPTGFQLWTLNVRTAVPC